MQPAMFALQHSEACLGGFSLPRPAAALLLSRPAARRRRTAPAAACAASRANSQQPFDGTAKPHGIGGGAAAGLLSALLAVQPASAATVTELFARNCAGCHAGGGNVIQGGATLSAGDLKRNGIDDPKALYDLVYGGRGRMPGYGKDCAPKGKCTFGPRLADEDIQQLTDYTLQQAAADWK